MKRELGYYWVKPKGCKWMVDEWCDGWVSLLDACLDADDHMYQEIDERRIEPPADPERVWYDHGGK